MGDVRSGRFALGCGRSSSQLGIPLSGLFLVDLLDLDSEGLLSRLALHHLDQARAVDDPELPLESAVFELEE
jgi:hypothetical protein